jgi:hypothetical protein
MKLYKLVDLNLKDATVLFQQVLWGRRGFQ